MAHEIYRVADENYSLEMSIDWRSGSIGVSERHESHNATDMEVYYGWISEFGLPDSITKKDWDSLNEELSPLVERAVAGFDKRWNGNNMVGTFEEDAQAAYEEICTLIDNYPWTEITVWDAEEWICNIMTGYDIDGDRGGDVVRYRFDGGSELSWETTDNELDAITEEMENGGDDTQVVRGMYAYLDSLRDECRKNYEEIEQEIMNAIEELDEEDRPDLTLRRFIDSQFRHLPNDHWCNAMTPARKSAEAMQEAFRNLPAEITPPVRLVSYAELDAAMERAFQTGHPKLRLSNRSGELIFTECCWPRWMGDYWIGVNDLRLDRNNISAARWQLDHAGIAY